MAYLKLFSPDATDFSSGGERTVSPTKAQIRCESGGDYYLEVECDANYIGSLKPHCILAAQLPSKDWQGFRIRNVEYTGEKILLKARHVYFDLDDFLVTVDTGYEKIDCPTALARLKASAMASVPVTFPFTFSSDIPGEKAIECVRISLTDAMTKLAEVYGGHIVRNNFAVQINQSPGPDRGRVIWDGQDLTEIRVTESWDDVVTRLLPVGNNELMLSDNNGFLTGSVQYDLPYCRTVTFSQKLDRNSYADDAAYQAALLVDLQSQGEQYLASHGTPKVNYTVNAEIDGVVDIGEIIRVRDTRLGLELETHVLAFTYDCLTEKYTQVEFGDAKRKLSELKK